MWELGNELMVYFISIVRNSDFKETLIIFCYLISPYVQFYKRIPHHWKCFSTWAYVIPPLPSPRKKSETAGSHVIALQAWIPSSLKTWRPVVVLMIGESIISRYKVSFLGCRSR